MCLVPPQRYTWPINNESHGISERKHLKQSHYFALPNRLSVEETSGYVGKEGFNVLRASNESYDWGGVNQPWLDSIIKNGQSVLVRAGGETTKREIAYLIENGYKQIGDMLIPPH